MGYEGNCSQDIKGTGVQNVCVKWGNIVKFERTDPNFEIADEATALLEATWQAAIQAEEVWPFPVILQQNVNDEDAKSEDLALGSIEINRGKKDSDFLIESNPYMDKIFQSHNNVKSGMYFIDNNGGKRGVKGVNGEFKSIPVQLFQVKKPQENNGNDQGFLSMIRVVISNMDQYLNDAAIIINDNFDFDPREMTGLQPVQLAVVGVPTGTTLTVKATIAGTTVPVLGLDETPSADFIFLAPDGITPVVPTGITDVGEGIYDVVFTALVTGSTGNLQVPSVMVTPGYKSEGEFDITF